MRRDNERGMTLIEIVTIMVILGIISLFSIGTYKYKVQNDVKHFAEYMRETIQVMQQKASLENTIYTLSKGYEQNITYMEIVNQGVRILKYEIPKTLDVIFERDTIEDSKIEFIQDLSPAYSGTILIKHRYLPYQMKMTVRPVTGLVTLYPLEKRKKD